MRQLFRKFILAAGLFSAATLFSDKLDAQTSPKGTDVPCILSYQGQVTTTDGKAMNGTHHITTTLYSDRFGTNSVWQGEYNAEITNGIFNILLGSGNSPLPEGLEMNRPLWFGIKVDGTEEMRPLSQLSAAAYSLNVPDKSITQAKLADDVQSAIFGSGHTPKVQGVSWDVNGNTLGADSWLGSKDSFAVEIHTYDNDAANRGSKRVMRYEWNSLSPNIIGGYQGNLVAAGIKGATICGGGANSVINEIRSDIGTIVGGQSNLIDVNSDYSAIVGGSANIIAKQVFDGYIGAGTDNHIHDTAGYGVVLGGIGNIIDNSCNYSFIGGGNTNLIRSSGITNSGQYNTITGGSHLICQSYAQTVMGHYNLSQGNSTSSSITGNDRLLIIGNGADAFNRSNAFEVSDNGHSIVYHTNGGTNSAITGATYKDNIIYAWAYYDAGVIVSKFGVASIVAHGSVIIQ